MRYRLNLVLTNGSYQSYYYGTRLAAQYAYDAIIKLSQVKTAWIE
jgi:hypothetical protein